MKWKSSKYSVLFSSNVPAYKIFFTRIFRSHLHKNAHWVSEISRKLPNCVHCSSKSRFELHTVSQPKATFGINFRKHLNFIHFWCSVWNFEENSIKNVPDWNSLSLFLTEPKQIRNCHLISEIQWNTLPKSTWDFRLMLKFKFSLTN